jgi:hypothetical protein
MALTVSRTHARTGILAPAMTGDPFLERANALQHARVAADIPSVHVAIRNLLQLILGWAPLGYFG